MTPADIEALVRRVVREEPSRELWDEAWCFVHPESRNKSLYLQFWTFCSMDAWRDAAAMLVPEGWLFDISEWPAGSYDTFEARLVRESDYDAKANISETEVLATVKRGPHAEARARLAAALRAHARSTP